MKFAIACLVAVLPVACRSAVQDTPASDTQDFVCVAAVGGMDAVGQTHVVNVLHQQGIECRLEGSIYYSVSVPAADKERAIEILRREQARNEHPIELPMERGVPMAQLAPGPTWQEPPLHGPREDVLGRPDVSAEVRALLNDKHVVESLEDFPYVFRIRVLPRRYLDFDGETRTGYDAEVEMSADPEARLGLKSISYNVLAGGRDVESPCSSSHGGLTKQRGS
jgi:hypothetical protein